MSEEKKAPEPLEDPTDDTKPWTGTADVNSRLAAAAPTELLSPRELARLLEAERAKVVALTKALQALVESMPECWGCEELATHWRAGSYVNEEACSRHSGGGLEMTPRAPAIRAAVALLAKQREAG